ncbi:hypothetical protein SRHO_G00102930 [Serrasalmus rhombeus]
MTVCSFFLQGRCRYGEKCWNEHPRGAGGGGGAGGAGGAGFGNRVWVNPQSQRSGGGYVQPSSFSRGGGDWGRGGGGGGGGGGGRDAKNFTFSTQSRYSALSPQSSFDRRGSAATDENEKHLEAIQKDMEIWQSSGQWAFSCYAVLTATITGFVELSPEELRLEYYTSRASGNLQSYANSVQQLVNQWRSRVQELRTMSPSTRTAMISELSNPRSQSSSDGGFLTPSSSGFGPSSSSSSSGFSAGGFGSGAQSSAGFSFAPSSTGFGSAGNQASSPGFGSGGPQPTLPGFGSGSSQPSSSGFGSESSQPSSSGFGDFGSTVPSSAPSASSFSFAPPAASKSSSGGFGSAAGFSFAPSTATASTGGGFGGGFGSSTPVAGGNLFNQVGSSSGGFGGGSGAAGASGENLFTPQSELTPEELKEFTAKRFTLGQIPLRPPPAELLAI